MKRLRLKKTKRPAMWWRCRCLKRSNTTSARCSIAVGAKFVETAPFYIMSTFIVYYATKELGFSRTQALNAVTVATVVTTLLIPLMGALSDRIGRKTVYIAGCR